MTKTTFLLFVGFAIAIAAAIFPGFAQVLQGIVPAVMEERPMGFDPAPTQITAAALAAALLGIIVLRRNPK